MFILTSCESEIPEGTFDQAYDISLDELEFISIEGVNEDYVSKGLDDFENAETLDFSKMILEKAKETNSHMDEIGYPTPTDIIRIRLEHPEYCEIVIIIYFNNKTLFETTYLYAINFYVDDQETQFIYISEVNEEINRFLS